MWGFHYAECGNFFKQNVDFDIQSHCMSLKKSKVMGCDGVVVKA